MPGWQSFYNEHKDENFEILSVAVDVQGPDVVKPYIENTTFKTVVDEENKLGNYFGFKVVPNGIFIDEDGTVRLIKQGFKVNEQEHVQALEKLIRHQLEKVEFDDVYYQPQSGASDLEKQLAETKFKLGVEYANNGKKDKAIQELDEALVLDQENFLIRKQRWYIRYPEKFSPTIDIEWQKKQLEKEKQEEAQLEDGMVCGPEGCYIPGT
ncbi:thioredoxin family protein [Halobacillus seohaensis]|uniref:Thioredoxin family protein n=1 Tax=Halobacillus seohaensis TaxID=447421 RepID=A0ABW2ERW8_9BACI